MHGENLKLMPQSLSDNLLHCYRFSVTAFQDADITAIPERSGAEPKLRQAPFPFTFLTVYSSLIIQSFDAVQCESQKASLNKQKQNTPQLKTLPLKGIQS